MIDWTINARKDLDKIISVQSLESYLQTNRKKDGTFYKKHRAYSIPEEAMVALEFIKIIDRGDITLEKEGAIKSFLMPFRTFRSEELEVN